MSTLLYMMILSSVEPWLSVSSMAMKSLFSCVWNPSKSDLISLHVAVFLVQIHALLQQYFAPYRERCCIDASALLEPPPEEVNTSFWWIRNFSCVVEYNIDMTWYIRPRPPDLETRRGTSSMGATVAGVLPFLPCRRSWTDVCPPTRRTHHFEKFRGRTRSKHYAGTPVGRILSYNRSPSRFLRARQQILRKIMSYHSLLPLWKSFSIRTLRYHQLLSGPCSPLDVMEYVVNVANVVPVLQNTNLVPCRSLNAFDLNSGGTMVSLWAREFRGRWS